MAPPSFSPLQFLGFGTSGLVEYASRERTCQPDDTGDDLLYPYQEPATSLQLMTPTSATSVLSFDGRPCTLDPIESNPHSEGMRIDVYDCQSEVSVEWLEGTIENPGQSMLRLWIPDAEKDKYFYYVTENVTGEFVLNKGVKEASYAKSE